MAEESICSTPLDDPPQCVLQCGNPVDQGDSIDNISNKKWQNLREKTANWRGLDRFGMVYESVNWEQGYKGLYMHNECYLSISTKRKLQQAQKRKSTCSVSTPSVSDTPPSDAVDPSKAPTPKRLRSSVGCIHDKNLCVWCMLPEDKKHPVRSSWHLLSQESTWNLFKQHTVLLDDMDMRDRILKLIDATPDPFAVEIRYHHRCWRKYITNNRMNDERHLHLQNVQLREAQYMFFQHVRDVIFEEHEIRTLQGLLSDYKTIVGNFGYPASSTKSGYIKEILIREFGSRIGFYARSQQNMSELVFDTSAGGTYIEAAIYSIGVSDEQLVKNVASRLRNHICLTETVPWPPFVAELEEEENLCELLVQLLTWLKKPGKSDIDISPKTLSLASLLTQYVTGRKTTCSINLSMTLHGLTKNKELVDNLHKYGIGISYADVLLLHDVWAVHDLQLSSICPYEIAEGKPAIAIIDNDDFKDDTLTGSGTSHRTNMMYVQPASEEIKQDLAAEREKNSKEVSATLKDFVTQMQSVTPYKTTKRGEPPQREMIQRQNDVHIQRKRGIIHALARVDDEGSRHPVVNQNVPGYAGFHASILPQGKKSKAYYHVTYPEPPKKTVVNDVMKKMTHAIIEKRMPFAILVGDLPVYILIMELKSENQTAFEKIVPFLGSFHMHLSFISAIYKRFKGSGLSDILVAAGVIVEGSVDQALRGKHYKRALRCLRLMYEALVHKALKIRLARTELSGTTKEKLHILRHLEVKSQETLAAAHTNLEEDDDLAAFLDGTFEEINASKSAMADFWLSFLDKSSFQICNICPSAAILDWMLKVTS